MRHILAQITPYSAFAPCPRQLQTQASTRLSSPFRPNRRTSPRLCTLYNPNGQLSFVGYPAREFSQPYVQVREGASLRYTYRNGYMASVNRGDIAENFLTVTERYADGSIARSHNTLAKSDRNYDFMGRQIGSFLYDNGSTTPKQTGTFSYDELGNLKSRSQSGVQTWGESFTYDNLNRLLTVTSTTPGIAGKTYSYSVDGNLTGKNLSTAVGGSTTNLGAGLPGTIAYGTTARPNGAGPHAVASANVGAGGAAKTFAYDANGNFTGYTDGTRALTYTPFNLPATITGTNPQIPDLGQASYSYQYDGDHARVKETYTAAGVPASGGGAGTTITTYVGNGFFEKVENADGSTEYRNYLSGPDGTLGLWSVNNGLGAFRFWHKDPLGSPILEYGTGGSETQFGFDPWGLRRKGDHTDAGNLTKEDLSTSGTYSAHFTPRGFTGHQHLDGLGLIHMNGRIYDPVIGRFLQADPIVQEPFNGQNFNRYTYVLNNPLAYTDPTGYSFWTEVRRPLMAIAAAVITYNVVYGEMIYAASALGPPAPSAIAAAKATAAIASGFAAGGVAGGNIESALFGAFSGGLLDVIGAAGLPWYEKAIAHAMVGCVGAGMNGDCGRNALAGGFASLAGSALATSDLKGWDNMATRSLVGGAASAASGGKFANGAFTAAFHYLLNDYQHEVAKLGLGLTDNIFKSAGWELRGSEISFVDSDGVRGRIDRLYYHPKTGEFMAVEVKYGEHSDWTKNQRKYMENLDKGRITFVGKNATEANLLTNVPGGGIEKGKFSAAAVGHGGAKIESTQRAKDLTGQQKWEGLRKGISGAMRSGDYQ